VHVIASSAVHQEWPLGTGVRTEGAERYRQSSAQGPIRRARAHARPRRAVVVESPREGGHDARAGEQMKGNEGETQPGAHVISRHVRL
jgi:hypothetical protein